MNLWDYLEKRNKRAHLKSLLKKAEEDLRKNAQLSRFIDSSDMSKIRPWHVQYEEVKERIEVITQKLIELSS